MGSIRPLLLEISLTKVCAQKVTRQIKVRSLLALFAIVVDDLLVLGNQSAMFKQLTLYDQVWSLRGVTGHLEEWIFTLHLVLKPHLLICVYILLVGVFRTEHPGTYILLVPVGVLYFLQLRPGLLQPVQTHFHALVRVE
jgi:hypothetical protein